MQSLPEIDHGVRQVAADTDALPAVRDELRTVAQATMVLRTMDGRMEHIEDSMPVLVEVQQHLARLPETITSIATALDRLAEMLDRLLASVEMLDGHVGALQESMQPIARVADRLRQLHEELGIDGILAELNFGGVIPPGRMMRSLRLLCEQVRPQFL